MNIRIKEAVQLMLKVNPELKDVLFDFSDPGKIDKEGSLLMFIWTWGLRIYLISLMLLGDNSE